jgi:hypothetical protein
MTEATMSDPERAPRGEEEAQPPAAQGRDEEKEGYGWGV